MRVLLVLVVLLLGSCMMGPGARTVARSSRVMRCPERTDGPAIHLDLASLPAEWAQARWQTEMAKYDGVRVTTVACAVDMGPTRSEDEGFMLWPCQRALMTFGQVATSSRQQTKQRLLKAV